ncbi:MAG: ribonuclease P protein component [Legionellales bacterium RIFCSPHIGHO2_12_FULL_42_9]|nr:MAG: ribonuclease P protein component [Legionellales bacterium RIFCSPHIGHO2_12_FULL_42_9]
MYRFDKIRRLRNKEDYESVFKRGNKTSTSEFVVLHQRTTLKTARLGFAISKKAIPKAHQRNRIKRLLRESFRKQTLPPVDVVFLAKQGIDLKGNKVLFEKLSVIWDKLAVLYEK